MYSLVNKTERNETEFLNVFKRSLNMSDETILCRVALWYKFPVSYLYKTFEFLHVRNDFSLIFD